MSKPDRSAMKKRGMVRDNMKPIRPEKNATCPACGGQGTLSREAGSWGLYVCDQAQECPEFEINYAAPKRAGGGR